MSKLSEETNFIRYIDKLGECSHSKLIVIAASDTPCGSQCFTADVAWKLMQVGFTIPLHNKWRCSYAAISDAGRLVFEGISQTHPVQCKIKLDGTEINVESACYGVTGGVRGCKIMINGKNCASESRGLAFAFFDKTEGVLVDSVKFDTYLPEISCHRAGESLLYKAFKERHPGVIFISPTYPIFEKSP